MRKFISLTSAKGESDPILQCIAKNSLALSSNPVQLPKGYCRLAQHIKFGLPTSRRQRIVTHQMLSTLTLISVGLAWKLNNVRGGTKIKLLYWSFEFHIWQDFKERTVTWGHFNGISQCNYCWGQCRKIQSGFKDSWEGKIDHTKLLVTEYQATSVTKLTCSEIILGLGIWLLYWSHSQSPTREKFWLWRSSQSHKEDEIHFLEPTWGN